MAIKSKLDFVHGSNINRLDKVLEFFNLLLELVNGDFKVLDNAHNLKFKETVNYEKLILNTRSLWDINYKEIKERFRDIMLLVTIVFKRLMDFEGR